MNRRVTVLALCAATALAAGACGHHTGLYPMGAAPSVTLATSADGVPTAGPRASTPATGRTTATPPRRTATRQVPRTPEPQVGPLVYYQRSGGIAGVSDEMVVERDGTYRISRRGVAVARGRLSRAELDRLRAVLAAAHFRDIPVVSRHSGADLMTYVVAYDGYAVTAMDMAVPAALQPVLEVLDDLLGRHAG